MPLNNMIKTCLSIAIKDKIPLSNEATDILIDLVEKSIPEQEVENINSTLGSNGKDSMEFARMIANKVDYFSENSPEKIRLIPKFPEINYGKFYHKLWIKPLIVVGLGFGIDNINAFISKLTPQESISDTNSKKSFSNIGNTIYAITIGALFKIASNFYSVYANPVKQEYDIGDIPENFYKIIQKAIVGTLSQKVINLTNTLPDPNTLPREIIEARKLAKEILERNTEVRYSDDQNIGNYVRRINAAAINQNNDARVF